jgi:polyhydroxyalkanoate synthesis regulator phasin
MKQMIQEQGTMKAKNNKINHLIDEATKEGQVNTMEK